MRFKHKGTEVLFYELILFFPLCLRDSVSDILYFETASYLYRFTGQHTCLLEIISTTEYRGIRTFLRNIRISQPYGPTLFFQPFSIRVAQ